MNKMPKHGKVYDSIVDTIGNTPMVKLSRLAEKHGVKANLIAKLEFFNPGASVKDRTAIAMIEAAEQKGDINKDTTIIECTSGNTGIALAMICAAKGYKLIVTMPETASYERRKMMALMGAELVITDKEDGMVGAIKKAEALLESTDNAWMPNQFTNPANPEIHRQTTAQEIWDDMDGNIDVFLTGVGTGGTITGTAEALRTKKSDLKIIVAEPEKSGVISGNTEPQPHRIQGIGSTFIPENLNTDVIDEVLLIDDDEAYDMVHEVARVEGIPIGISAGAIIHGAIEVAKRDEMAGKNIVLIVPSYSERYLSTPLFKRLKEMTKVPH